VKPASLESGAQVEVKGAAMEKNVLLPIDNSRQTIETIQYAAQMAAVVSPVTFTLLHIQPALSQYLTEEAQRKRGALQALEKVMTENEKMAREILETAAMRMIGKGVDESRIKRMTLPRNTGVADDILALGAAKSYDAILVGRRGASYLRQWLMGSVTANLVEHSELIPIWVVDSTVPSSNILLAADGSQATLRALDHLAFMLSGNHAQAIKMLHIRPRIQDYCEIVLEEEMTQNAETVILNGDQQCMTDFNHQAITVLRKNGLNEDCVEMVTLEGKLSVTRSILNYARDNGFGTVVLGRRGQSNSAFFGSVSRGLLQRAEGMALWVVP
jgi:nucleotide-binding universal stress UspA family protein